MDIRLNVRNELSSYLIRISTDDPDPSHLIWLERETGEGISLSEKDLFEILDTTFHDAILKDAILKREETKI